MGNQTNKKAIRGGFRSISYFVLIVLAVVLLTPFSSTPLFSLRDPDTNLNTPQEVSNGNSNPNQEKIIYTPLVSNEQTVLPGIWISYEELQNLPTSGAAWEQLLDAANEPMGDPDLSDQDDDANVLTVARALVYARTGQEQYRTEVKDALEVVTFNNSENGGRTLALGRNLFAYVIAADLIDLRNNDPALDRDFRLKLRELLHKELDGRTLVSTHEDRPNNWGTHAGASRIAVALYLYDNAELNRATDVFKGWLGDRDAYAEFEYASDMSWQCNSNEPVGINPQGCTKDGHSIDGAQPEEMRRGGSFKWPPAETGYPWEALQGAVVTAEMLQRAGYSPWAWEDQALLRSVQFLYNINWDAEGDDEWQLWLLNRAYGTTIAVSAPSSAGKNMGWTDWTHGSGATAVSDLTIEQSGTNDVMLSWTPVFGSQQIWQSKIPYFNPADNERGTILVADDVSPPVTVENATGYPGVNHYFTVINNGPNGTSGSSNRTGTFDYSVTANN